MDLTTSVAPFILRGVTLAGVEFGDGAQGAAVEAWNGWRATSTGQAGGHDRDAASRRCDGVAPDILAGKVRGRVVLEIGGERGGCWRRGSSVRGRDPTIDVQ